MPKRPKRLINDSKLEPFFNGVDEFCKKYIPRLSPKSSSHKIIADPVEGYSCLDWWEISIVDTVLFQRLRGIRQLGLAYLVYPTLGYSRFEHVLGVRARLDQIITTLRQNPVFRGKPHVALPTESQLIRMRIAVLCHDIGHCLFSHVSEGVVGELPGNENYPSAALIRERFSAWAGRDIPISEVLSVAILTSPIFINYLHRIGTPEANRIEDAGQIAEEAAHLILGLPIPGDPKSLFLAQLMNSGLDVDKLDYMLRESLFSGISLGISLQWLMKKLFIALLPGAQLPKGLLPRIHGFSGKEEFAVLSLERGGQFGFEEFCVARLALHEKIYLHQKIRAAEVQIKSLLRQIIREVPPYEEVHRWLYLNESVAQPAEGELPESPDLPLFASPMKRPGELDWSKIRHRQLPARAFAFGWQNSIADPLSQDHGSEPRRSSVDELMDIIQHTPQIFIETIRKRLKEIVRLLDDDLSQENIERLAAKTEILVDPPRVSTIQQGHDTLHIEYPPRLSLRWMMPIDQIESYYYWNRALGYVFTTADEVAHVLLATEMAAWDLCQVVCVQEGLVNRECVKMSRAMRVELNSKGFYAEAPPLRPVSPSLEGVEAQIKVGEIARKLAAYESKTQKRVSPASVTSFVAQFDTELQDAVLAWLEHIDLIRPEDELKKLIPSVVHEHLPSFKTIGISPLGAPTDSAFRLSYNLREPLEQAFGNKIIAKHIALAEALGQGLDAYMVFDDNTNSGYQALNILAGWLGKEIPEDLRLREDHVQPLKEELRSELLAKPLFLLFGVATEGALGRLKSYLIKFCEMNPELVECRASRELGSRDTIFSADSAFQHDLKLELKEFVAEVARQIFVSERKSEKTAKSRSLGDSNAQAMVVFPYNCPTMTIPALWLTGPFRGHQWLPLVERGRRRSPQGDFSGEDA